MRYCCALLLMAIAVTTTTTSLQASVAVVRGHSNIPNLPSGRDVLVAGIPGTGLIEVRHRQRDTSISYLPATRIVSTTEERGQIRILARLAGQRREFSVELPFADLVAEVQRAAAEPIAPLTSSANAYRYPPEDTITGIAGAGWMRVDGRAARLPRTFRADDVVFIHGRDTVTEVYVATISGRNSPSFEVELFELRTGVDSVLMALSTALGPAPRP